MAQADFKISTFKGALASGGARPSLFDISIQISPTDVTSPTDGMTTQCQVSAIPGLTVTPIERQYFGRTVKIPGDMVFADLTTTIINTESFSVRAAVEQWMDTLNGTASNYGFSDSESGYGSLVLTQYSKEGKSLMKYTFEDAWPQTCAEVALSYDTASDIETFDVTWAYNYYTTAKGNATGMSSYAKQE